MVNGLYKVLLRFYLPSTIFPPFSTATHWYSNTAKAGRYICYLPAFAFICQPERGSLNATAGRWKRSISATRCATTRSICLSIKASLASNASCHSSTVATTPTLSLPFSRQVYQEGATASARTSQAKSSPNQKKTCSNTAPTAPTLSILSISAAKSSPSTTSWTYL